MIIRYDRFILTEGRSRRLVLILFFFLFNGVATAWANAPRCSEVFEFNPEIWSLNNLRFLGDSGRSGVRRGQWEGRTLRRFRDLNNLSLANLNALSIEARIGILDSFAKWNLIAGARMIGRLEASFGDLSSWRPNNFLHFSLFRKMSPQEFSPTFVNRYQRRVFEEFHRFDTNTKLEVLGAEIIQGNRWTHAEMVRLLDLTAEALRTETKTLRFKPVKEFYRALIYLRATQPSVFFRQSVEIEALLNAQLAREGLSLDQGGISGSDNPTRPFGDSFYELVRRIDEIFPGQQKQLEVMDPARWGFFDPVDLYYPNLRLVVEWDGPIHYFRVPRPDGGLDPNIYILRPLDRIKDLSLNRLGIAVLRWGRQHNDQIETIDIQSLIETQNPGVWESVQ